MSDKGQRKDLLDVSGLPAKDSAAIQADFEKYAKKGFLTTADVMELNNKYNDSDVVEQFLKAFAKRYERIRKTARKYAEKFKKYALSNNKPLHVLLEKAMKLKKEFNSDREFEEFRRILTQELYGNNQVEWLANMGFMAERSRISRTLGMPVMYEGGFNIKESEYPIMNEIKNLYSSSRLLHNATFMQALMYSDMAQQAISGDFDRSKHRAMNHIHPILAAMFLPKIAYFEVHMIYANLAGIVVTRYEGKPIMTEPDAYLFHNITHDPNDANCDPDSAIADLRNRSKVQIQLWDTVTKLREGKFYEATAVNEFLAALDGCRNNLFDDAALVYNRDEGAILRRLMNVFSMRPTVVQVLPLFTMGNMLPGFNMNLGGLSIGSNAPYGAQPVATITTLPLIRLQLPYQNKNGSSESLQRVDIRQAGGEGQTVWISEKGQYVPKLQKIVYSTEILIFYINRRQSAVTIRSYSYPISFNQLPLTASGFEHVNTHPVGVPTEITLDGDSNGRFILRSVVAVVESEINNVMGKEKTTNIITGCTALFMTHPSLENGIVMPRYHIYDPYGASLPYDFLDGSGNTSGWTSNKPVSEIEAFSSASFDPHKTPSIDSAGGLGFNDRASRYGTIFIYNKSNLASTGIEL